MEFTREPRENQGKINERALNFRVGGGVRNMEGTRKDKRRCQPENRSTVLSKGAVIGVGQFKTSTIF